MLVSGEQARQRYGAAPDGRELHGDWNCWPREAWLGYSPVPVEP